MSLYFNLDRKATPSYRKRQQTPSIVQLLRALSHHVYSQTTTRIAARVRPILLSSRDCQGSFDTRGYTPGIIQHSPLPDPKPGNRGELEALPST
jgi:hypothetical protein